MSQYVEHSAAKECYEAFLSKVDSLEKAERIEAIKDLIHRLEFELRWQSLAPNQVRHMCDESLSEEERRALKHCKPDQQREERITMYARATYFRRCAWIAYLNGDDKEPPIAPE